MAALRKAKSDTGGQVRILTDSAFTKARILAIDEANMRRDLDDSNVIVVAGFQGADESGTSRRWDVAAAIGPASHWPRR